MLKILDLTWMSIFFKFISEFNGDVFLMKDDVLIDDDQSQDMVAQS